MPAAALAATTVFFCLQAAGLARPEGGVDSAQSEVPAKARVLVKDNYFEPRSTEVLEGGQVVWKWRGENRHNIRFTKVPEGAARKGASAARVRKVETELPPRRGVPLRVQGVVRHARLGHRAARAGATASAVAP